MGGDGDLDEFVGEDEEGGGDKIPPSAGGTATGEAFGEGFVEVITAQIFPQEQNVLVKVKQFRHHYFDDDTFQNHSLKLSNFRSFPRIKFHHNTPYQAST